MFIQPIKKTIVMVAALLVIPLVTGCGGNNDGPSVKVCRPQATKDGLTNAAPVYVSTRDIAVGDVMTATDVQQQWCEQDAAPIGGITDAAQVVGHKAVQPIKKGWVLGLHMISE